MADFLREEVERLLRKERNDSYDRIEARFRAEFGKFDTEAGKHLHEAITSLFKLIRAEDTRLVRIDIIEDEHSEDILCLHERIDQVERMLSDLLPPQ